MRLSISDSLVKIQRLAKERDGDDFDPGVSVDKVVEDALTVVFSYADGVDDWVTIKRELLKNLPSRVRRKFSAFGMQPTKFERWMMERWSATTGRPVILKQK